MSDLIMVSCSCGREYNAGALSQCPACGLPVRASSPTGAALLRPGLPPADELESAAAAPAAPRLGVVRDEPILSALKAIQRNTEESNERLRKIWWALFAIWAPIILIFASLLFGWVKFDFVIGPAG